MTAFSPELPVAPVKFGRVCRERNCEREAAPRLTRCYECWLRAQPPVVRAEAAQRRLELVPEAARRARVPEKEWPPGRRWCAGCQSFMLVEDCSGSRCKACTSKAAHLSRTKATFGIDESTYTWLLAMQGGRCAICRGRPKTVRLAIDHDHAHCKSGCSACIRGLLCSSCNHDLLGAAHDSVVILRNAVAYLEGPPTSGDWQLPSYEVEAWQAEHPEATGPGAMPPPY